MRARARVCVFVRRGVKRRIEMRGDEINVGEKEKFTLNYIIGFRIERSCCFVSVIASAPAVNWLLCCYTGHQSTLHSSILCDGTITVGVYLFKKGRACCSCRRCCRIWCLWCTNEFRGLIWAPDSLRREEQQKREERTNKIRRTKVGAESNNGSIVTLCII